jgi:hypothetical protein
MDNQAYAPCAVPETTSIVVHSTVGYELPCSCYFQSVASLFARVRQHLSIPAFGLRPCANRRDALLGKRKRIRPILDASAQWMQGGSLNELWLKLPDSAKKILRTLGETIKSNSVD